MSWWWRKRRDAPDPTTYHVRRADVSARQMGGFMMLAALLLLIFLALAPARSAEQWRAMGAGTACLTIGVALFGFGDLLRRRQQLWLAQALLALGGSLGVGFAGVLTAATFQVGWARALTCPAVLGLLFIWPVIWHAAWALRELRSRPTTWSTGFQPLVGQHAPLPVTPLPPEPQPQPQPQPLHRSDSSR